MEFIEVDGVKKDLTERGEVGDNTVLPQRKASQEETSFKGKRDIKNRSLTR